MELPEPRWLSADEREAWIALSKVLTWLPQRLDAQLQRDAGISHAEYQVLSWISMAPDRAVRMSRLAEAATVSLSHLSRVVARLEARGWVERRPDPDDGRATRAHLTPDGWGKVVATAPGHVEEVRRLVLDPLPAEDVARLRGVLDRLVESLGPGDC